MFLHFKHNSILALVLMIAMLLICQDYLKKNDKTMEAEKGTEWLRNSPDDNPAKNTVNCDLALKYLEARKRKKKSVLNPNGKVDEGNCGDKVSD